MRREMLANLLWLLAYLVLLALVVGTMFVARERVLRTLDTPQARASWEAWREAVRQQQLEGGPVQRRVPKSPEPNLLVLMRDHYYTLLAGAVLFSSLLFFVAMVLLRGALRRGPSFAERLRETDSP